MRKFLAAPKRIEIRRLLEEEESTIEVSEAEKILSHIAYLMCLFIEDDDSVRERLKVQIGVKPKFFGDLSNQQVEFLASQAPLLKLPKRPLLVFWMWRSWLLQKDMDGIDAFALADRNANEWFDLSGDLQHERCELSGRLSQLAEDIRALCDGAIEARYALDAIGGSPLAVIRSARRLLLQTVDHTFDLELRVSAAYGFGSSHRPNKRFDKKTLRNLKAFYNWNHHRNSLTVAEDFMTKDDGTPRTLAQARKLASQVASRVIDDLNDFDEALRQYEEAQLIPTAFYARRLERLANNKQQSRAKPIQ